MTGQSKSKLKVALSAIHYPVTMARFFWEALERREDVELITIGPYFGDFIPWDGGIYIDMKYVKSPTVSLPMEASRHSIPYVMVKSKLPSDLDLFLIVDAGWHFLDRPEAKKVALVETDPHVLKRSYDPPKKYSDYVFCMQTPYLEEGEIFLPYACDTHRFYPEEREIKHDACLIGLHYPKREALVNALKRIGLNVYYDIGVVYDDYRRKYNESRVALNWSSLDDLPSRVWEGFGMKRPVVSNRITDLSKMFVEDEDYLGFSSVPEAVAQVTRLLQNPKEAAEMAERAYNKVIAEHTWDMRVDKMLKEMGLV